MAKIAPHHLSENVDVTHQLQVDDLAAVRRRYRAVVDLRPDGEAPDQPSSLVMEAAAKQAGLDFIHVPVPHGAIPEESVERLHTYLASHHDVLLYCRSGKRAARTWALAEAKRPGGLSAEAILVAVHGAGQDAGDLKDRIEDAVLARQEVRP